ncbi:4-alpha-glucanotransferase [Chitinibacter sp. GC72]|uniref:4-alpha-glucanotransferase n=1 Tax=Chitinibacter sp. GC72 TaxID=1526917 RepID=UPI0012F9B270|nr:4-alpha-glucanotransferase [Chitinibacter sp. GC72]
MSFTRASGLLAHITSLPSNYGIGDLGPAAYRFVDFLHAAEQTLWQVLPLGLTSYGDSPYQSFSTFAGNHYLISPELLMAQGLLSQDDIPAHDFDPIRVDYGNIIPWKMAVLRTAFANYRQNPPAALKKEFSAFCKAHAWLDDFALFVACKFHFIAARRNDYETPEYQAYYQRLNARLSENQIKDYYYGAVWNSWPDALARREKSALAQYRKTLADEIAFYQFLQFIFFQQWQQLKSYANERQIKLIGDIPIFVSLDSADVWSNRELFALDEAGDPIEVAGVPPDYFSATGQLWGNPLYRWPAHKDRGFTWWIERVAATLQTTDILRIDHFRAFAAYWAVPFGEATAVNGQWKKSPGKDLFAAIESALGKNLPIIAEDLGIITDDVTALRLKLKLPGMKVLQFAFEADASSDHLPHNYPDCHTVVYTGTHDNDTTVGWYTATSDKNRDYFRRYMNSSGSEAHWDLIRLAWASNALFAIAPVQDVIGAASDARMNTPGVAAGNWQYRFSPDALSTQHAERLAYLGQLFARHGSL